MPSHFSQVGPTLYFQVRHMFKFFRILRDEHCTQVHGMGSDQEIPRTDWSPLFFSSVRIEPYTGPASLGHAMTSTYSRKSLRAASFCLFFSEQATPYHNSAETILDIATSPTARRKSFLQTGSGLSLMIRMQMFVSSIYRITTLASLPPTDPQFALGSLP